MLDFYFQMILSGCLIFSWVIVSTYLLLFDAKHTYSFTLSPYPFIDIWVLYFWSR